MRIVLSPMGTTGDIRPFIALGISLKKLGCLIKFVVPQNAESICKKYKFDYQVVAFDYREIIDIIDSKPSIKEMVHLLDKEISSPFEVLKEVAKDADLIIGSPRNYAVQPIAELYRIPYYQVCHTPQFFESRMNTPWRFSRQNNPIWINYFMWKINNLKEEKIGKRFVNKHRINLGLKPSSEFANLSKKNIVLVADRLLGPVPNDVKTDYMQTDYWHLFEDDDLSCALIDFISDGDKPIFISFGSMPDGQGEKTMELVEQISKRLSLRVVVQKGWAGLNIKSDSKRILMVEAMPHYKLFPHMAAIIHHGGAGTLHTAALLGIPQIVIPQFGDQFYWGDRVRNLNLGPKPVPKSSLTENNLMDAIEKVIRDESILLSAQEVAVKLNQREDMDRIALKILNKLE